MGRVQEYIRKKKAEFKHAQAYDRAARATIDKKAKAEYYRAREQAEKKLAKVKAYSDVEARPGLHKLRGKLKERARNVKQNTSGANPFSGRSDGDRMRSVLGKQSSGNVFSGRTEEPEKKRRRIVIYDE